MTPADFPTVYFSDDGGIDFLAELWRDAADVVSWMRTAADAIEARTA